MIDDSGQYDILLGEDYPALVEKLATDSEEAAVEARAAFADLLFSTPVAIYWNPMSKRAGYGFASDASEFERRSVIDTLDRVFGTASTERDELAAVHADDYWVKVAYSPTVRAIGEALHYFPSKHLPTPGGRPVAAAVASTLLGTGLGYGTGALIEKFLPQWAQQPGVLRKKLALGGGLAGLGVGSVPGLVNKTVGRRFDDPTLWHHFPEEPWQGSVPPRQVKFASFYAHKCASDSSLGTVGGELPPVEMDALGRVVWGSKLSPELQAMTMGALYGASRVPDPNATDGAVTPHQVGMFGLMAGAAGGGVKGYLTGRAVGMGLGALTGMPTESQDMLARTGLAAGIIGSLVPRLFQ
jgi:hypothetical protein